MKRLNLKAVVVAVVFSLAITLLPLRAQVWGDFDNNIKIVQNAPYTEIVAPAINPLLFIDPFTGLTDRDDGYYQVVFPPDFRFEFNGEVHDRMWICVNGFITFSNPPRTPAKNPNRLFSQDNERPWNVIAPFWGDHYYRIETEQAQGFLKSEISYVYDSQNGIFTVQWKNLNINYPIKDDDGVIIGANKQSYANFQLKLYKAEPQYQSFSNQGKIEFCYGPAIGTQVVVTGSSVGIRGESGDYLNGLIYENNSFGLPASQAKIATNLTIGWQPSGGSDKRIQINPIIRYYLEDLDDPYLSWGDGDVDLSHGRGLKHDGLPKNRYVTVYDVLLIMRSISTGVPLDPVRRRMAYHGDVNHNGRYYIDSTGKKILIPWRDKLYYDNINKPDYGVNPPSPKSIRYEVTEYDAALILHYISGRVPTLPWLIDTFPKYGKIMTYEELANNIRLGTPISLGNGTYQVPVYLNGTIDGALGLKFELNSDINDILQQNDESIKIDRNGNRIVVAASGTFSSNIPLFSLVITPQNEEITAENIRLNDNYCPDVKINLSKVETTYDESNLLTSYPNPFNNVSYITLNVPNNGFYTLSVYDVLGNKVKTIFSDKLEKGLYSFNWNGTDDAGNLLPGGMYIYRLTSDNMTISTRIMFNK